MNRHLCCSHTAKSLFRVFCHEQFSMADQQKTTDPHIGVGPTHNIHTQNYHCGEYLSRV